MIRYLLLIVGLCAACPLPIAAEVATDVLSNAQLAVAKVYGLGGVAGLEGYQTGVFIGAEPPMVITIDSPVLDGASITLIDAFGQRSEGRLVGRDGPTGLALVACPDSTIPPAVIDWSDAAEANRAERVWALSNSFAIATGDEPVTVQRGRISAVAPMPLPASVVGRFGNPRPALGTPAAGSRVLLLDAVTSNPGAGGGLVINSAGSPIGLLGAECRSPVTGAWINYATPAATVSESIARIRQADDDPTETNDPTRPATRNVLRTMGLVLIPSITPRAPAYIDQVIAGGPADRAGCQPDDLIVTVESLNVGTVEAAATAIADQLSNDDRVVLTVLRNRKLIELIVKRDAP